MKKINLRYSYILAILFFGIGWNSMTGQTVNMEVQQGPNIDVVLTVGITDENIETFEQDLGAALASKGIPADKLYVQGFERTTISSNSEDAADIFNNWVRWGYNPGTWEFVDADKFIRRTNNDYMAGFYDPVFDSSNYTLEADIAFTQGSDDDDMGITFGMENGPIGSYLFNLSGAVRGFTTNEFKPGHGFASGLYKITKDDGSSNPQHYVQGLQSAENVIFDHTSTTTWYHFKIVVSGKNVKIYMDDALIINYTADQEIGGSYGFFSNSQPYATFKNIEVTSLSLKKFKDVLREPQWRNGAMRFNVNLDDQEVADFDNDQDLAEILMRTINENIHYIGWGLNDNKSQFERFVQQNNDQGTFVNRDTGSWSSWIDDMAQYIYEQYQFNTVSEGDYFIAGTSVEIAVDPSEMKTGTANANFPNGRWKITHDETFFPNNQGRVSWNDLYLEDVPEFYEKTGKYTFTFENLPTAPTTLYFHRKPVASFTYSGDTGYINNTSYDLDGGADNGIAQSEWKWKSVDATATNDWVDGQFNKNSVEDGEYLVMLKVQDHQGTWSSPTSIYVEKTTSSGGETDLPIAQFNILPDLITTYTGNMTITVEDNSVDPYGRNLSTQQWIVTQRVYDVEGNPTDTEIYNSSTPMTDFSSYNNLSAEYIISLRTKTDTGVWSEPFYRTLTIVDDNTAPTITADPSSGNLDTDTNVQLVFQDENGGSGFDVQRFARVQSATPPATNHQSWTSWSNSQSKNTSFNAGGSGWYIHAEVMDNAGNVGKTSFGPYDITFVVSADDDLAILDEDTTSAPIDVLYNDVYDTNSTPTLTIKAQGTKGNAIVNSSNQVVYTPNANENGTDTVTYELDDNGTKVTAVITLSIIPVDDKPIAVADSFTLDENGTLNEDVSTNDVEVDGDDRLYHLIDGPEDAASFTLNNNGTFSYVHNGDESATDSFTYNFEDALTFTETVTVTLNITNVNDAPEGGDISIETIQNAPYTFGLDDFIFTDEDSSDTFNGIQVISLPSNGTLAYNGTAVQANDMIDDVTLLVFTPVAGEYGANHTSFTFKVKDNSDSVSISTYKAGINTPQDTDGDGIPNDKDPDDDGDGTPDDEDDFPLDPKEDKDTDGDGIGDNEDKDDDGDGTPDDEDDFPLDPDEDTDTDGDGIGDNEDEDDDGDGTPDDEDDFPLDPDEDTDTDGDGIGDNEDEDDDGDGTPDDEDDFPLDPYEDTDTDGDGIGDNADDDADDDGVADVDDAFPTDKEPSLAPAQAFTPNGDGNNDAWVIPGIDNYPNNVVHVYNRWGHEVFGTKSYRNNWEGFYKNRSEKLPPGSYMYVIDLGDGSAPLQGWIFINY
jgi:gliding motility-associated-like protein